MTDTRLTDDDLLAIRVDVCVEGQGAMGLVTSTYVVESKSMVTRIRRHEEGFSVTQYNKLLPLAKPGEAQELRVARHQEWSATPRFDQVAGKYAKDVEPEQVV